MTPSPLHVQRVRDEEACELAAVAALAAAEAGAPPSSALDLALGLAGQHYADIMTTVGVYWRRVRFALTGGEVEPDRGVSPAGVELVRLVKDAESNGDDLRDRLNVYLENSFERRDFELRQRIEVVPVYMIIVLVLFFMPAILLVLVGPSFLALLRALYEV